MSSSLVVHHSSPVPILSPAQQEIQPRKKTIQPCELPAGTVPKSPTPIQRILDNDPNKCAIIPMPCPGRLQMREVVEPLPTPMPGTNIGFSENDLAGGASASKQNVMSFREGSSYFEFPVCDSSNDVDADLRQDAQHLAEIAAMQDSFTGNPTANGNDMVLAALDEVAKARLQRKRTLRKYDRGIEADSPDRCEQRLCALDSLARGTAHIENHQHAAHSAERCYSPIDIEHVVFEDYPEAADVDHQRTHDESVKAQALAQLEFQKQAQATRALDAHPESKANSHTKPALNAWGTQGSLYDGTGYGDSSSSSSPRPSTSYNAPKAAVEMSRSTVYTADSLAEDSAAMARDHETLEEVIRAYAAFEEEGASGISEDVISDVVAEAKADVELAEKMADYSLGA